MSQTQSKSRQAALNDSRIARKAHDNIKRVIQRYQSETMDNATLAYDEAFWEELQIELGSIVQQYIVILEQLGNDHHVNFLADVYQIGIVSAIEEFRGRIDSEPYEIQNDEQWEQFREDLFTPPESDVPTRR